MNEILQRVAAFYRDARIVQASSRDSGQEMAALLLLEDAETAAKAAGYTGDDVLRVKHEVDVDFPSTARHLARGALEDLQTLSQGLRSVSIDNPTLRYISALVSELAYHHGSNNEVDALHGRAILLPCAAARAAGVGRSAVTLDRALGDLDIERPFIAETDAVVAVGA